jgi:hypothetical protein
MPGYDGTGPAGMGPMTGGGRGFCAVPGAVPGSVGYLRPGIGRFFGRGGGRGRRNMYYATGLTGWQRAGNPAYSGAGGYSYAAPTVQEEREILKSEAENLKRELEDVQRRIETLESKS